MKNLIFFLTLILIISFSSCAEEKKEKKEEPQSELEKLLQGEHRLQKMGEKDYYATNSSENFFLFSHTQTKEGLPITLVEFSWQLNNGDFAFSTLPREKFRLHLDSTAVVPTIKFRWLGYYDKIDPDLIQEIMDKRIIYVLITTREKDWPADIVLPMNKK